MERYEEVQDRINLLKQAPSTPQHHPASLDMGYTSRAAMLPALNHALLPSTKNCTKSTDNRVFMNLQQEFRSEEGLPGLINAPGDQLTVSNYWLSSEAPNLPDFEEVLADWISVLSCPYDDVAPQPDNADDSIAPQPDIAGDGVAPQPNLADFDIDIQMDDETITSVMSIIDG